MNRDCSAIAGLPLTCLRIAPGSLGDLPPPSPPAEQANKPSPLWSKAKSSRPAHQFALPLKADKSPHQHGECGNRSTLLKKSKREERKGSRGGNCLKGWMLAVPRCSGRSEERRVGKECRSS